MTATLSRQSISPTVGETSNLVELDDAFNELMRMHHRAYISAGDKQLVVPESLFEVLCRAARDMSQGNAILIMPLTTPLTTQQAADILNVSRQYLVRILESGELPFSHVGTHRRVLLEDLLKYKDVRAKRRHHAQALLAKEAQSGALPM